MALTSSSLCRFAKRSELLEDHPEQADRADDALDGRGHVSMSVVLAVVGDWTRQRPVAGPKPASTGRTITHQRLSCCRIHPLRPTSEVQECSFVVFFGRARLMYAADDGHSSDSFLMHVQQQLSAACSKCSLFRPPRGPSLRFLIVERSLSGPYS